MRVIFMSLVFCVGMSLPGAAQDDPKAIIKSVIQDQIAAFQADDFPKAFSFASPTIKGVFGTSERFGAMVQQGYPMVYRPEAVRMLGLRDEGGLLWQRVMITDSTGAAHMLDYQVIETPDGWQINAVQLLPQSGMGA